MSHPTGTTITPQEAIDIRETGAPRNGEPQFSTRRLYLQLQAYTDCGSPEQICEAFQKSGLEGVVYKDVNDPWGIAILLITESPELFVEEARKLLTKEPFQSLKPRPEMTMLGRTYSGGREADLEDWLLRKPRRYALNSQWPWAIWYPLRRKSEFELLSKEEQGKVLFEHAKIGMSYGQADLAHDIRLACHGLDAHDNEFVIGLIGADLFPLSRLVQDMRRSQQTARYIQSLGPFFVGKAIWQSPLQQ